MQRLDRMIGTFGVMVATYLLAMVGAHVLIALTY